MQCDHRSVFFRLRTSRMHACQQRGGLQQTGQLDQQTMSVLGISQAGSTTGQGGSTYGNNNASGQKLVRMRK
jgi:hypothetical protein